jgi:hypothetical protein
MSQLQNFQLLKHVLIESALANAKKQRGQAWARCYEN